MKLDLQDLNYIINHVFLPLKLPQKHDPDSSRKDGVLLSYAAEAAQLFSAKLETLGSDTVSPDLLVWRVVTKMLENAAHLHQQQYLLEIEVEAALLGMRTNGQYG
jgi:hypothetical protein